MLLNTAANLCILRHFRKASVNNAKKSYCVRINKKIMLAENCPLYSVVDYIHNDEIITETVMGVK